MSSNENVVGGKFQIDISDLKKGLADANRQIRLSNSEFQAAAASMGDWTKSEEGLTAKIKQLNTNVDIQKQKVSALQKEYEAVAAEKGANSKEAQNLKIRINNETKALNESEKALNETKEALANFGKEEKKAEESTNKLSGGLKSLASGAGKAIAGLGVAAAGLVTGFLAMGEATQDTIEDLGKLETAFTSAGHSAETGQKSYEGMVGILGETDQSVEAVSHLAKLTKSEEELAKWTDIAAGVYGTFGDSLPIEGLTEAANETAKVGQVTGPLADALTWAGISEEEFNKQLAKCNSEQERATLITNTLNDTYMEAAKTYKEVNGDLIAAREATANMNNAMAEMGRVAMPITTALKNGMADLVTTMLPGLNQIGTGITGLINGVDGSQAILTSGITVTLDMLLSKITGLVPIVSSIAQGIIPALLNGIINALPTVVEGAAEIIVTLANALLGALPQLTTVAMQVITTLIDVLTTALPQIVIAIVEIVPEIIDALLAEVPQLLNAAIQFLMAIVDAIPQIIQALIVALPRITTAIIDAIVQAVPQLLKAAIELLMAIVDAIPQLIKLLTKELPKIITTIVNALVGAMPQLLNAAIQFLMAIVQAIPQIIEALVPQIPTIVQAIVTTLISNLPVLLDGAFQLFMALVDAIPLIIVELTKALPKVVKTFLDTLKKPLQNMFGDLWKGLRNGAKEAWNGIKAVFSKVGQFFGDTFRNAWQKVKDVFSKGGKIFSGIKDGIVSAFKKVVNTLIGGINKVIKIPFDKINDALSTVRNVSILGARPFSGLPSISVPQIPELYEGAVLERGQKGFLEGKGAEAVVPLHNNKKWIRKVAEDLLEQLDFKRVQNTHVNEEVQGTKTNQTVVYFTQNNTSPKALRRIEIYRQTKNALAALQGGN